METLAVGIVGWAGGIVTVFVWAVLSQAIAPQKPRGKARIGFIKER